MSAETLKLRNAIHGETLDQWGGRQHEIDTVQEERRYQEDCDATQDDFWSYYRPEEPDEPIHKGKRYDWGDTYDVDADERAEERELEKEIRSAWRMNDLA